jgi:hypothetical protein
VNKYLALIVFMLWAGGGNWHSIAPVVILEGDVIMGNQLPEWGQVCIDSVVRGGPDEMYDVRYSVSGGQVVRLHEPSKPDGAWVSIGAAQWMPLDNICSWNGE